MPVNVDLAQTTWRYPEEFTRMLKYFVHTRHIAEMLHIIPYT